MSTERRLGGEPSDEPSLGMSVGLLCAVLLAMFAIVVNISIPEVQLAPADLLGL
jgi:hypothetical protein